MAIGGQELGQLTPIADILPLLSGCLGLLTLPGVLIRIHLPLENEVVLVGGDSVVVVELKNHPFGLSSGHRSDLRFSCVFGSDLARFSTVMDFLNRLIGYKWKEPNTLQISII